VGERRTTANDQPRAGGGRNGAAAGQPARGTGRRALEWLPVRGEAAATGGRLDADEILLGPTEAAEVLGVSGLAALRRLTATEGLPHVRVDEPLLFPARDIAAWAAARAAGREPDEDAGARRAVALHRLLVAAGVDRRRLVAFCNAAISPPDCEAARRGRGRPRLRATSPNATTAEVVGVMVSAVAAGASSLARLCEVMERAGLRDQLAAAGNGRALDLLESLEQGTSVERRGPRALDAAASLELPGVWDALEDWVATLLAALATGAATSSPRLRSELVAALRLLREGATGSPMVLLQRLTLFQIRSLAAHLGLAARRDKASLVAAVASELRTRFA
jgi:hypothetical protein